MTSRRLNGSKRALARGVAAVSLITVVSLLVAACSSPYVPQDNGGAGQTASELTKNIESVDGVSNAEFEYDPWSYGTLVVTDGMNYKVSVDIEDGYVISKPKDFLRYTLQEAWSANENSPKGTVHIDFQGGVSSHFLWRDELTELFGEDEWTSGSSSVTVSDEGMKKQFGSWPGTVEALPQGVVKRGEVPVVLPLPLSEIHLGAAEINGERHVINFGASAMDNDKGELYSGDIKLTIYDRSKVFTEATIQGSESIIEHFDYSTTTAPRLKSLSYKLEFEPQDGFDTTSIEGTAR